MKAVMISIRPKWVEEIASGEKTIEVRKTAPKLEIPFKCYIYETKGATEMLWCDEDGHFIYEGRGQVIGEFVCDKIEKLEPKIIEGGLYYTLNSEFNNQAMLDNWELSDYGKGKPLYGWHISDLKIYDKPKEISEFHHFCTYPNNTCEDCAIQKLKPHCHYGEGLTRPFQSWGYVEEKDQ